MFRRLTVSLVLAAAATTAVTTTAATPALATGDRPAPRGVGTQSVAGIAQILQTAYSFYKSSASGGLSLEAATAQIIAAINSAKAEIISHIDAVAIADARACSTSAVINFADFEALTPDNKQAFALNATSCVALADALLGAVSDLAAVDQLGFAVNAVGPIALITRSRTGLTNPALISTLIHANNLVISRLAPHCHTVRDVEGVVEWFCTAYNGQIGRESNRTSSENQATANTSRPVAKAALTQL